MARYSIIGFEVICMILTPKKQKKSRLKNIFKCCYAGKLAIIAVLSLFINVMIYFIQYFRGIYTGNYSHYFFIAHIFKGFSGNIDLVGIIFIISKIIFLVSIVLAFAFELLIRIYDVFSKEN